MPKTLQECTLLDRFLFDQTMDCPEAHEAALQIILNNPELSLLTPAQTEKELRTAPWLRSIRLDVFALDETLTVYSTEMQKKYRADLVKRSRYYQALVDSSLLEPGSLSFNQLNNAYIILIMPFDLFGLGKYCYTFQTCCRENNELWMEDGITRIFLNTRGMNDEEVGKELRDFLHYIERTDERSALEAGSERIWKIHNCVQRIRSSEEMGVKYMQAWEEKALERLEGKAEGKAEAVLELLEDLGRIPEELRNEIMAETDLDRLKIWHKLAARCGTIEEFCQKRQQK